MAVVPFVLLQNIVVVPLIPLQSMNLFPLVMVQSMEVFLLVVVQNEGEVLLLGEVQNVYNDELLALSDDGVVDNMDFASILVTIVEVPYIILYHN